MNGWIAAALIAWPVVALFVGVAIGKWIARAERNRHETLRQGA